MSRAGVGFVVEQLFTDLTLRFRFSLDKMGTVADLLLRGVDLTLDEMEILCRTDVDPWFTTDEPRAERQH